MGGGCSGVIVLIGGHLILAAFVSPLLVWAGGAAASIPILIHLLSKRRYRQVRWAAMDFLLEAERRNRRRVRIEELILLALRCLAMFLIGLMLARWFIRPEAMAAVLGAEVRTERIVILDDSYSMAAATEGAANGDSSRNRDTLSVAGLGKRTAGGPVVFDSAKASLLRLLTWLKQESPGDSLSILLTSRPDQPLRTEPAVGHMDLAGFEAELTALAPSSRGARFPVVFEAVRTMLEARKEVLSAAVYVISDFQQIDWTRTRGDNDESAAAAAPRPVRRGPAAALAGWDGPDRTLRILLMDVGRSGRQNLTVTAIEPQQTQAIATVSGNYVVRVANFGETESSPSTLQMYVGDASQPAAVVPAVAPGGTVEVPVEITFPGEGYETLTVELAPDDLAADNTRATVVPVERSLRILVVNGEPSSDPYQDEAFLLQVALRPEGPQFSGNDIAVVDENDFEASELSAYHVVVLANVYRVTEEVAARLEQFVSHGGGLAIFVGDQVDTELYDRILYRGGKGLLPGRLTEVVTAPAGSNGAAMGEVNVAHPAMRRFRDPQVPYFQGVVTYQYLACEPAAVRPTTGPGSAPAEPDSEALRTLDAGAATQPVEAGPRPPAQVLLRYDDAGRLPALIERTMGTGRVILATTSVDKEWTNLPERPVYIVLLMEMVQYLARPGSGGGDQLVGQAVQIPLDPMRFQHGAMLRLPSFPDEPALRLEALPSGPGGSPLLSWTRTDQPGVYRFVLTETAGGEQIRPAAVNVDPVEGDLRHAERGELLASMTGLPVEYVSGQTITREQDTQARRELWSTLLLALVIVLMCEQTLAWWFGGGRWLAGAAPQRTRRAA